MSELLALNIFRTFYVRTGWEGVGQAKSGRILPAGSSDRIDAELADT